MSSLSTARAGDSHGDQRTHPSRMPLVLLDEGHDTGSVVGPAVADGREPLAGLAVRVDE